MIAVTGATGFLGGELTRRMKTLGMPFVCLVRPGSPGNEKLRAQGMTVLETNFADSADITRNLAGCGTVIHAMGLINGSAQLLDLVNIHYTRNLARAASETGIRKFIFISSVAALMRHGPYGESKYQAEAALRESRVPHLIFRPAYIYGMEDRNNTRMMIKTLKHFPLIPLLGGGTFKLQPVFVEDVVELILKGLSFSRLNTAYTVAGKEQVSLRFMLETLAHHLKVKRIFVPIPLRPLQAVLRVYLKFDPATKLPAKQILELDKHEAFNIAETQSDFNFDPVTFAEGAAKMFGAVPCAA